MDVDVAALGVFVAIAGIVVLTMCADFRRDMEKRARLEKARRHR